MTAAEKPDWQLNTTTSNVSSGIHWCDFHSNRSTFEKVSAKIQRVPIL